jgi:hypothetical protein
VDHVYLPRLCGNGFERLGGKIIGKPCEGKLHARLDVAGNGNPDMVIEALSEGNRAPARFSLLLIGAIS